MGVGWGWGGVEVCRGGCVGVWVWRVEGVGGG